MDNRTLRNIRNALRAIQRAEAIMKASRVLESAGAIGAEQDSSIRLTATYDAEVQADRIAQMAIDLAADMHQAGREINEELTAMVPACRGTLSGIGQCGCDSCACDGAIVGR